MSRPDLMDQFDRSQVRLILESALDAPIVDYNAAAPVDVTGGATGARPQLFTVRCTMQDESRVELTAFVKRCAWKNRPESVHYRHLAAAGVPTPRLYGALCSRDGEEIVFLESLSAIGFRMDEEAEWRAMLSLLARFNACSITTEYVPHLHPYEQVGNLYSGLWILGMEANPPNEAVEAGLRASGADESELPALLEAAQALLAQVDAQPQGLLHQDFMPNNVGWRGERAEMVVFDVHKNARGPRFADVAPYLGVPDWSSRAGFLDAGETDGSSRRERLARHYLSEYARFGGPEVPLQAFWAETAALSWAHKVTALPALAERQPARAREVLDFLRGIAQVSG